MATRTRNEVVNDNDDHETTVNIKQRHSIGDRVRACDWDKMWHPATVVSWTTVKSTGSSKKTKRTARRREDDDRHRSHNRTNYGEKRIYNIKFDDGTKPDPGPLDEIWVMSEEDYALTSRLGSDGYNGVKNVTADASATHDEYATIIGWYETDLTGSQKFARFAHAIRARDDAVVNEKKSRTKREDLHFPDEWGFDLGANLSPVRLVGFVDDGDGNGNGDDHCSQKERTPSLQASTGAELLKCSACSHYYTTERPRPGGGSAADELVNRVPVMLPCCGNTACSSCAEAHRESNRKRRGRPPKKIDCLMCGGSFEMKELMPNRLLVSLIQAHEKASAADALNPPVVTKKPRRHEDDKPNDLEAEKRAVQQAAAAHALDVAKKRSEIAKSNWDDAKESYENAQGLVAAAEEKVERARQALNTAKVAQTKAAVALGNATYDKDDTFRLYKELLETKSHGTTP